MPKCEKCNYERASFKWCKRCGRTNPCPVRKGIFFGCLGLLALALLVGGVMSAKWVAQMRADAITEGADSFVAPRDAQPGGKGGGGRRGGTLSWR